MRREGQNGERLVNMGSFTLSIICPIEREGLVEQENGDEGEGEEPQGVWTQTQEELGIYTRRRQNEVSVPTFVVPLCHLVSCPGLL